MENLMSNVVSKSRPVAERIRFRSARPEVARHSALTRAARKKLLWSILYLVVCAAILPVVAVWSKTVPVSGPHWGTGYEYLIGRFGDVNSVVIAAILLSLLTALFLFRYPSLRAAVVNELKLASKHGGVEMECPLEQIPIDQIPELRDSGLMRLVERRKGAKA